MAILILMLTSGSLAALGAWLLLQLLQKEYARYRTVFEHEAAHALADFFLFLDPGRLWGVNLIFSGAVAAFALALSAPVWLAGVAGLCAVAIPPWGLAWARARRRRRLDDQLPDFLLALAGALRAGSGLQAGLRQLVPHTGRPLSQELGLMLQQQRMGVTFNDALDALHVRVTTESVSLVVAAIKVAGHTGGSLAETLERIAHTLRTRLQLLGRVQALTSQGRMQAWIMAALPVFLALALHALDPESMSLLWTTPVGWIVLVLVAGLECLGVYLVRKIVDIEV